MQLPGVGVHILRETKGMQAGKGATPSPDRLGSAAALAALLVMRSAPPPVILLRWCEGLLVLWASHVPRAIPLVIGRPGKSGSHWSSLLSRCDRSSNKCRSDVNNSQGHSPE